jgi:hypothetical protein
MKALDKVWVVKAKGGFKYHLMRHVEGAGTPNFALCGQHIPLEKRLGSACTVAKPKGNECLRCLIKSGHAEELRVARNKRAAAAARVAKEFNIRVWFDLRYWALERQQEAAEAEAGRQGMVSEGQLRQIREQIRERSGLGERLC